MTEIGNIFLENVAKTNFMTMKTLEILKKYWGYQHFRPLQKDIIEAVLSGENCVALLPTGGGKSLCFQIPTLFSRGLCVVVSPLIALMEDQIKNLKAKNIKAVALTGNLSKEDVMSKFEKIRYQNINFLYLSPERITNTTVQECLKNLPVKLLAIDEAHCISEWGHDFRPAYRNIKTLQEIVPTATIIALTATATPFVLKDIQKNLNIEKARVFSGSLKRENISYQVRESQHKTSDLLYILNNTKENSIVYVNSRNDTKVIAQWLCEQGITAGFYNGGMDAKDRQKSYEKWKTEETRCMVATNAFGMGIDKGNICVVVHMDLPNSLENYQQESGRAGRDGKNAKAILLIDSNANDRLKKRVSRDLITIPNLKKIHRTLYQYFYIASGELREEHFDFDIFDFAKRYGFETKAITNALKILNTHNIIKYQKIVFEKPRILLNKSPENIINYQKEKTPLSKLVVAILRTHPGVFSHWQALKIKSICAMTQKNETEVTKMLIELSRQELIHYSEAQSKSTIQFLMPREDNLTINRISKEVTAHQKNIIYKAEKMMAYVDSKRCRSRFMSSYFENEIDTDCGNCDICETNDEKTVEKLLTEILSRINTVPKTARSLLIELSVSDQLLQKTLQKGLEKELLKIDEKFRFTPLKK